MTQQALAIVLVAMLAFASVATVSATSTQTVEQTTDLNSFQAADFANASEWTDTTSVTDFEANDSKTAYTEQNVSTTNPEVRLVDNETDEILGTWTEADLQQTHSDTTNDDYAYRLNFTHGDLSGLDIRANETKDVEVRYKSNASVSDENATFTNVTVGITAADDYNNFRVSDSLITTTDYVTFKTDGFTILNNSFFADKKTHFDAEGVSVNGTGSTIALDMANQSANSRLSSSLEDVSESNWDKSTLITLEESDGTQTFVKGYTSLPDEVNATTDTYALIDESSGKVDIHLGEDFENTDSVDVNVKTNVGAYPSMMRGLGLWQQNFEWTFDHFNPLTISLDADGLMDGIDIDFDRIGSTHAIASPLPIAVGRPKLA